MPNRLGDYLVGRRRALGLERKDVAERSGLSYPYVSQLETGMRRPSSRAIRLLADALEVSAGELSAAAGERWSSPDRDASRRPSSRYASAAEPGWYGNPVYAEQHFSTPPGGSPRPIQDLDEARKELLPRLARQLREYSPATRLAVLHDLQADALAELARGQSQG